MKKAKIILFVGVIALLSSCASKRPIGKFDTAQNTPPPQYADLKYWAAHPDKADFADRIPSNAPELEDAQKTASVDVFFLHPTTYTIKSGNTRWNAALENAALNTKTDESPIQYQASIFNGVGRVFAPRYRQAHIAAYFTSDTASAKAAFELAYQDIRAAFVYYLEHWNGSRPIIIASHSQGTTHATRLMKEFFDGKTLQNRLIVAYTLGMPLQKDIFQNIPLCEQPTQTGCYCAWRTFADGYEPPRGKGANIAVVNPLTWRTTDERASADLHEGAVLFGFKKMSPKSLETQIHNGILWTTKPKFRGSALYRNKNYHAGDFNLFYMNVRNDVKRREGYFWK